MARAIELAARARGRTSPNPMVGAVLVRGDAIVGEGFHARAGESHAETIALAQAGTAARGADLYVNLEPCSHHGRTPPCADAIVQAGVARVFAAMRDPNPKVDGRGIARLRAAGVKVQVGLLGDEAARLNEIYCTNVTTGLPQVTLKIGMSLDGKTATRTGEARWITGEASRKRVHEMRDTVDAVLVGIGTILADDPDLTTRLAGADCRHPDRVVIDSHLRIPSRARVLAHRNRGRTILIAGPHAAESRVRELRELGAEVIVVDGGRAARRSAAGRRAPVRAGDHERPDRRRIGDRRLEPRSRHRRQTGFFHRAAADRRSRGAPRHRRPRRRSARRGPPSAQRALGARSARTSWSRVTCGSPCVHRTDPGGRRGARRPSGAGDFCACASATTPGAARCAPETRWPSTGSASPRRNSRSARSPPTSRPRRRGARRSEGCAPAPRSTSSVR